MGQKSGKKPKMTGDSDKLAYRLPQIEHIILNSNKNRLASYKKGSIFTGGSLYKSADKFIRVIFEKSVTYNLNGSLRRHDSKKHCCKIIYQTNANSLNVEETALSMWLNMDPNFV